MTKPSAVQFSNIVVRKPAASVTEGLRTVDIGPPNFERLKAEHDAYIAAMTSAGVAVDILPALDGFPDSIFVEDPALEAASANSFWRME